MNPVNNCQQHVHVRDLTSACWYDIEMLACDKTQPASAARRCATVEDHSTQHHLSSEHGKAVETDKSIAHHNSVLVLAHLQTVFYDYRLAYAL